MAYVRAKRKETTVFVYFSDQDTVTSLITNLATIVKHDPAKVRLLNQEKVELNNEQSLKEANISNDDLVYFVYQLEDSTWEQVSIPEPKRMEREDVEEGDDDNASDDDF
eukprot:NODE_2353_length_591_cov_18.094828_g2303_i0.p1 GENE.NODE_2353_length_591_cov_18.094828_g2303_i0~~NODE_2353_length_591_cov_18.094828_g2303_i0.p1  ORF type:complete len:109 (+),score=26.66 NODE_2353_length_591_cov_18.094828_g2303_i0:79-405(+)